MSSSTLAAWVADARRRTLDLIADLSDEQLLGPRLAVVNPPLWEVGHLAWFAEKWVLRHAGGRPPLRADADALYDSSAVPHRTRWDLPLPSRAGTLRYMAQVQEGVVETVRRGPNPSETYFVLLSVFHEDMHGEAFLYARQTLGWPRPVLPPGEVPAFPDGGGPLAGDAEIPGGDFLLGAGREEPFVFDNEKWAHPIRLRPFAISRAAVTQAEFAEFVEAGGYGRPELWSPAGWRWRESEDARQPLHWRRDGAGWLRRDFDRWVPLEPHRPMIHANWHEADAWCRWRGRRLPTEAEWEAAAGGLAAPKRRFPWGDDSPNDTVLV
ncbi:MAG: SUMF1/EgtB/PvdO family nonheme iron enzyme, partial [Gemmataceae bacterium]|nr:SUMF1/EgtB/PvdO family nonheme iron enzyme [Gemmataceae bacterium]